MLKYLESIQEQVIIGSLLGDGSLNKIKGNGNSAFREGHGFKQSGWTWWKYNILKEYCISKPKKNIAAKSLSFNTINHNIFTKLDARWYLRDENNVYILRNDKRIKIIPEDIIFTPLIASIWYIDDGWHCWNSGDRRLFFSTHCFSEKECMFLVEKLKNIGVADSRIKKDKGIYLVHIGSKSFIDFINLVKNVLNNMMVPDCIKYKYNLENYTPATVMMGETHPSSKYTEKEALSVIELANLGMKISEISTNLNVSYDFAAKILDGVTWKHLNAGLVRKKREYYHGETRDCEICGKKIYYTASRLKRTKHFFCCKEHQILWQKSKIK